MDKVSAVKSIIGEKKLSIKEKIGPTAVIFTIFITGLLFLRPTLAAIQTNSLKLQENKGMLSHLQAKKSALKSYQTQERQAALDEQLRLISRYVPSTKPSLQTLLSLTAASRNESLEFSGLTLKPGSFKSKDSSSTVGRDENSEGVSNSLDNFDLSFSVIGKKANLESFVSKLKELAPMMRIDKFSTSFLKNNQDEQISLNNDELALQMQLNLKVYYQRVPDKLPALTAPLQLLTKEEEELIGSLNQYVFATSKIPTVESLGQGGDIGNQTPFKKAPQSQVPAD